MAYYPREDGRPNFFGIGTAYGSLHGRAKLTEALVTELRAQWNVDRYRKGFIAQWAREHGVEYSVAYRALTGETWKNVTGAIKPRREPNKAKAAQTRERAKAKGKKKKG